ncbi:hypothetical protein HK405_011051 [Cladochytrium tenue]|nr:hypothetical protein HK405_011051 [Cladochytrium tenue]
MGDDEGHGQSYVCCAPAKWKREEIPDHKFDYIDVDDFTEDNWVRKFKYSFVFLVTLKSILVYIADVIIVALLFINHSFQCDSSTNSTSSIGVTVASCNSNASALSTTIMPQTVRPWLILVTVFLSFVLLIIDWRKAQAIIRSKDISYAFTSPIAYRYYALRSYPHYCFFCQIQNSRKTVDVLAFFVFFMFKGWKRLLLAEFPRQLLNALNLYDVIRLKVDPNSTKNVFEKYYDAVVNLVQSTNSIVNVMAYALSTFTVVVWLFSFCGLLAAFFVYIPLLCNIRGNLKEYCCHKIDKRIGELLRKKSRKRTEEARKAELAEIERSNRARQGGYADSESEYSGYNKAAPPLGMTQRPTLPDIDIDLDAPPATQVASSYGHQYPPQPMSSQGSQYGGPRYAGSEYGDNNYGAQGYNNAYDIYHGGLPPKPQIGGPPSEDGSYHSFDRGGHFTPQSSSSSKPLLAGPYGPVGAYPPPGSRGSPAPGSPQVRPAGALPGPPPPPAGLYGAPLPPMPWGAPPPPPPQHMASPAGFSHVDAWLNSQIGGGPAPSGSGSSSSGSAVHSPRALSPQGSYAAPDPRSAPSRPMMPVQRQNYGRNDSDGDGYGARRY